MAYEDILVPPDWLTAEPLAGPPAPELTGPPALDAGAPPAPDDWVPPEWGVPEFAQAMGQQATPDELAAAPLDGVDPSSGQPPNPAEGGVAPLPGTAAAPAPEGQDVAGEPLFPWQIETLSQPPGEEIDYRIDPGAEDAQVAAMMADPEKAAGDEARREAERADLLATRTIEEDTSNRQRAERNATEWRTREAEYRADREQVLRETEELGKQGVNNDHWWESRSTGGKISAFVTAIIGGLLAPNNGGKNSGIEFISNEIERDIATQKANLAHRREALGMRRGILADLTAANGDVFRAEEAMRMAAYQNVDQRLAAEAQRFDPMGTKAQVIAKARMAVQEKIAKAKAAADEAAFDRKVKEHGMRIAAGNLAVSRGNLAESRAQRIASTAEAKEKRVLDAKKDGFIYDEKGDLVRDPTLPTDAGGYEEVFDPETGAYVTVGAAGGAWSSGLKPVEIERRLNLRQERQSSQRAGAITDTAGNYLGRARGTDAQAGEVRLRIAAHGVFRQTMARLMNTIQRNKTVYKGLGSSQWPSEAKAELESFRTDLANQLAKLRDPTTANREAEVAAAMKEIPDADGWIESKEPMARYNVLVQTADDRLEASLATDVEGYVKEKEKRSPTNKFREVDKIISDNIKVGEATPAQTKRFLTMGMAQGTSAQGKESTLSEREAVLDRWVRDQPWMFEDLDVAGIRSAWAADKTLTPEDRARLDSKLTGSIKELRRYLGSQRVPVNEETRQRFDPAKVPGILD